MKLLTVDLDDTLWDVERVILRAEQELYRWFEDNAPAIAARFDDKGLRRLRIEAARAHPELLHDLTRLRIVSLQAAATAVGEDPAIVDRAFEHFWQWRNRVEFFPGVTEALDELTNEYRLVALSNGNADLQMTGLHRWFEFGLSSIQVGHAKPHPAMFEQALDRIGCAAGDAIHVGDDPVSDVAGAQAVGMRSVWVNQRQIEWPGGAPADLEIENFAALPTALTTF